MTLALILKIIQVIASIVMIICAIKLMKNKD